MNKVEIMHPRFVGERFEGGVLPLDILRDMAVLQEMIIEIAKWKYKEENADRVRALRGFASQVELRLTGLEEGSAKLTLSAFFLSTNLLAAQSAPECKYLKSAPQALVAAIDAANQDETVTEHLPKKILSYFNRFGRNLRDGESIELYSAKKQSSIRYDTSSRKKMVRASESKEYTAEVCIRATIPEADQQKDTFTLMRFDGKRISAPIPESQLDSVLEAFNGFSRKQSVEIHGIAKFDQQERIVSFEEIHHVDLLDPLDVGVQLDQLRVLKDGWLDGAGNAPKTKGLDWLTDWFKNNFPSDLSLPCLYPTPAGGVQAEWSLGDFEVSLDVDVEKHNAVWHSLEMSTDKDEERKLGMNDPEDSKWLVEQLSRIEGVKK